MSQLSEVYLGADIYTDVEKVYKGTVLVFDRQTPVLDPATQALLDQATTDGYTAASGTVLTALDTFIKALKSNGVWNLLDVIWLPATNGDSDFATYNLKDPSQFQLTKVNSPIFTTLEGFTGDGVSAYLDTGFNLSTDGTNFQLNSACSFYYERTNLANNGYSGAVTASNRTRYLMRRTGSFANSLEIGTNSVTFITTNTFSDSRGFHIFNRENSTTETYYKNGALGETRTISSNGIPNTNVYVLAFSNSGTAASFSPRQFSCFGHGSDMSANANDFYNAIQAYMTTLGTEV